MSEEIEMDLKTKIKNIKNDNRIYISTDSQKNLLPVQSWVDEIIKNNITDLEEIKQYLVKQKSKPANQRDVLANIIATILSCKMKEGRVMFNSSLFTKKLHFNIFAGNIEGKCLTNDILYLYMVANSLISEEFYKDLLDMSDISEVTVTSDNFKVLGTSYKGYIQDYDTEFSAITADVMSDDVINKFVKEKENLVQFSFNGSEFISFGDGDICIICQKNMNDSEIIEKCKNIKFIKNQNNLLADGQRKVYFNDNVYYVDKTMKAETFCPAFIVFSGHIKFNYLFEFEIDYNLLFELIENNFDNKVETYPLNLCYWDTINTCFDFFLVMALTARIPAKIKLKYTKWYTEYNKLRTYISKWKENQLLFQRIISDFIYGFLNNSEYERFLNLEKRVNRYCDVLNELKKHESYSRILGFFGSLPFATYIVNQLNDKVYAIANNIKDTVKAYVNGSKTSATIDSIKSIARAIQLLTPRYGLKQASFPLLMPDGGLSGGLIDTNEPSYDPVLMQVTKNASKQQNKKKKEKKDIQSKVASFTEVSDNLKKYVEEVIRRQAKMMRLKVEEDSMNDMIDYVINNLDKRGFNMNVIVKYAEAFKKNGRFTFPRSVSNMAELAVKTLTDNSKGGNKKKRRQVEAEVEEEEVNEEEEELEPEETAKFNRKRKRGYVNFPTPGGKRKREI